MALPSFVCPNAENCKIYQAWKEEFNTTRIDVIQKDTEYFCEPVETLARRRDFALFRDDSQLKRLVSNIHTFDCFYVEILNLQQRFEESRRASTS